MTPEQLELLNESLDHEYAYWRDMATDPKPERHAKMALAEETRRALNVLIGDQGRISPQQAELNQAVMAFVKAHLVYDDSRADGGCRDEEMRKAEMVKVFVTHYGVPR